MKYISVCLMAFTCSSAMAEGLWDTIVGDRLRNSASSYCINDGISAAGYFNKDREIIDARYELCIARYVNQQIRTQIEEEKSVQKELDSIQRQIDELIKQRELMLKGRDSHEV